MNVRVSIDILYSPHLQRKIFNCKFIVADDVTSYLFTELIVNTLCEVINECNIINDYCKDCIH